MFPKSRLFRFSLLALGFVLGIAILFPASVSTVRTNVAEQQWQTQYIRSYRIQVQITGAWMQMLVDTTVQDGHITRAICTEADTPKPCTFPPDYDYTVPGLFALARIGSPLAARTSIPLTSASCLSIAFDSAYHYPADMHHDCRETLDDEWSTHVQSFEVLK